MRHVVILITISSEIDTVVVSPDTDGNLLFSIEDSDGHELCYNEQVYNLQEWCEEYNLSYKFDYIELDMDSKSIVTWERD